MADKAADLATKIIPYPTISELPTNDTKSSIKHKIFVRWQNHWDTIPPTNKLKLIMDTKNWIPPYYINRRQEVAITTCKIGHSFITHSFQIKKKPSPHL